jgi:acyl-CoA thioesterase-1
MIVKTQRADRFPKDPACRRIVASLVLCALAYGCGGDAGREGTPAAEEPRASASAPVVAPDGPVTSDAAKSRPRVVILGDSLTAGLGLPPQLAYPALLQERIDGNGLAFEIVNAGVSGDTSAGGLRRLDWALEGDVRVLVLALGANDGLRGLPVAELRRNLSGIIRRVQEKGVEVVLAGMEALPNLGPQYAKEFHDVYPSLAREFGVPLVPFLLDGVAGVQALNQPDGIHPSAEGAQVVAENVWKVLEPLLRRTAARVERWSDPSRASSHALAGPPVAA